MILLSFLMVGIGLVILVVFIRGMRVFFFGLSRVVGVVRNIRFFFRK